MTDNTKSGSAALLHAAGNYFATPDGKAVYLAGDHTWTNNVGYSNFGPFDFGAYLDVLQAEGANITRYWACASSQTTHNNAGAALLMPFQRSGQGQAQDGGTKFDLTKFNQSYFDHVRADVQAAGARGIYVSIMLFFDNDPNGIYDLWRADVWNGANNVNGTTTSNASVQHLGDPRLLALQEAYVAKVIDTVGDLPNVLFEVANEASADPATNAWQNTIIDFVHQYEAQHGDMRHPVGMTATWPVSDWGSIDPALNASHADWISPNGAGAYQANPPDATGNKVQLVDTDHIFGMGGDANWVWQQFTRGQNVLLMDDMSGTGLPGLINVGMSPAGIVKEISSRLGLLETRQVAQLVDLTHMKPADGLASTGFALADPASGQYVVYAPSGGPIRVDLSQSTARNLDVRWVNVGNGQMSSGGTAPAGSAAQGFAAPFGGAAALVLTPHGSITGDAPSPAASAPVTVGNGPDALVLTLSEDAWNGDAQFALTVDNAPLGGPYSVTALRSAGASQTFTFNGSFGSGPHTVGVSFINDAWGGTADTDRNLYLGSASLNGQAASGAQAVFKTAGTATFSVGATVPAPVSGPAGDGADTLVLSLAEDAWGGDAQFAVTVDGKQLGGTQTVTAASSQGMSQSFTYSGNFGAGAHVVGISFLNDAWGGTADTDRNLYVKSVTLDGQRSPDQPAALWSNGTANFGVSAPASSGAPQDDSLVLHLSEDAWNGDAQFVVSVDGRQLGGVQSVAAPHSSGGNQDFTFHDGLGAGSHDIAVTFLNDAYGGSATTDRNLYVGSVDYHGTQYAGASAALHWSGAVHFELVAS